MKITETTPPRPPRTFTVEFSEAELNALAVITGSVNQASVEQLLVNAYGTTTDPEWDNREIYNVITEILDPAIIIGSHAQATIR